MNKSINSEFNNSEFDNNEFNNSELDNKEFKNIESENQESKSKEFENKEFEKKESENIELENIELDSNSLKSKLQRNVTVVDLAVGIIIFGIICEIVGMFIVERKLYYSFGLWIGVLSAIGMAIHMNYSIGIFLTYDEKNAIALSRKYSMLRYAGVAVILGILMITNFANPISAFVGLMGLKIAAYMQPLVHKAVRKFIPDLPPAPSIEDDEPESNQ